MPEKRIVSRREPIVVDVEGVGEFSARPLPWRKRNDLGDLISAEYITALNKILGQAEPLAENEAKGPTQVKPISLIESGLDYTKYLELAFPDTDKSQYEALDFEAVIAVLSASLEVNGLERLGFMIDPAKKGPETEPEPDAEATDGVKIESLPDSSSPESDATNESN